MTENEKKRLLDGFRQPVRGDDEITDDWTEEEILEAAKRIMKELGIEGHFANPDT